MAMVMNEFLDLIYRPINVQTFVISFYEFLM